MENFINISELFVTKHYSSALREKFSCFKMCTKGLDFFIRIVSNIFLEGSGNIFLQEIAIPQLNLLNLSYGS